MKKIKYLPLESDLAHRMIHGPLLHIWHPGYWILCRNSTLHSCTFQLELKYQHEKSKNTTRIRGMGLSSRILGCACTWEGSWLTLRRTCKTRVWVCKFRKQILVLSIWAGLCWRGGWSISRTVRPAGRLNCKLSWRAFFTSWTQS